ncbi:MAG: hypothetical protein AAFN74_22230, partial [Myxococcota bacterium]
MAAGIPMQFSLNARPAAIACRSFTTAALLVVGILTCATSLASGPDALMSELRAADAARSKNADEK